MTGTVTIQRITTAGDEPLALAARSLDAQPPTPLLDPAARIDPSVAARSALHRYIEGEDRTSGWAALGADGTARALLCAVLEVTDEDHPSFTYAPPRYAQVALSGWHVATASDAEQHLPTLVTHLAADARPLGITRLMVQTRPHDWIGGALWRSLGLQPDNVLAGRRTTPDLDPGDGDVHIRPIEPGDEPALVSLSMEEHEYHAAHTNTGTRSNQPIEPTLRNIREWLAVVGRPGALLAVDRGRGEPLGCMALHVIDLPEGSPGLAYYPPRYGYIGLTSVTQKARGRGLGRALTSRALAEFTDLGLEHVMLHYIDDNQLSRPFWTRVGFSPHVVTLAGDVLR